MNDDLTQRAVIVGAGMSGILAAIKFRDAGYDVTVYEKADDLGGTWRDNHYPGLSCDIPSPLYSYSFAPNPDWSALYAPGPEIRAYLSRVADDYHVRPLIRFGAQVTRCTYEGRWHVSIADGRADVADVLIFATGILHQPNYPALPGLQTFRGTMFHSTEWQDDLDHGDARVGVIGTGSTAVQIVSALSGRVGSLSVFQRTAQWIFPRRNRPYTDEDRRAFREDPGLMEKLHAEMAVKFAERFSNAVVDAESDQMHVLEQICLDNLEQNVPDPELRAKLMPSYRAACKRLVMDDDFYAALQSPTTHLITSKIERIEPDGVRTADGRLHELDVLVLATGFKAHQFMRPIAIEGPDGLTLDEAWGDTVVSYRSIGVPGFPNLFTVLGPYSPVGNFSLIEVAEVQVGYILELLAEARRRGAHAVALSVEATARLQAERVEGYKNTIWVTGCRSWYLDDNDVPATWPFTYERFLADMAHPVLEDFDLLGLPSPADA